MDYILSQIRQRKDLNRFRANSHQYVNFCRIEVEYACIFLLGYLWNKNINNVTDNTRETVFQDIVQPSIGTIVDICRRLDLNIDFFKNKRARLAIVGQNGYPNLRNKRFGHGFVFDDKIEEVASELERLSDNLFGDNSFLSNDFQIVLVTDLSQDSAIGTRFGSDGIMYPWQRSIEGVAPGFFKLNNVYVMEDIKGTTEYTRLSPFVLITNEQQIYLFSSVADRMIGRTKYYRIFETGEETYNWPDFSDDISEDTVRRKSANGTILNVYQKNFSKYIDIIGVKRQIRDFLLKNRASVCGGIWGHGGVGKTAAVQSICDDLSLNVKKAFDYIVFASAKDRAFSHVTGHIYSIDEPVDSYENLVKCINSTMGLSDTDAVDGIVGFEGRLLIVIDDYETFSETDQKKIEAFIRELNTNNHKVLITTRANITIGDEFVTHELEAPETTQFLIEVMQSQFPDRILPDVELKDPDVQNRIFKVTSGRPLFIFYFVHVWGERGTLAQALDCEINSREDAIEFLFGRIYNYLSPTGKDIYRAIGHLVTTTDLTHLISKLRFIVNMEDDEEHFSQGLAELAKLRVIEIFENDLFRVYSTEVLGMMRKAYDNASRVWRSGVNERLIRVTRDRNPTDQALLDGADAARASGKSEAEVKSLYRQVLNRDQSPPYVKSQAVRRLAEYLFRRSDRFGAIRSFQDYREQFRGDALVAKMHANYCWHVEKRDEAVEILMDYIRVTKGRSSFELLGLCLTFRASLLNGRNEELEARHRTRGISENDYDLEKRGLSQDFKQLSDEMGLPLFKRVREVGLADLSGEGKQNVISGLYLLSGVCMRLEKFREAREICEFAIEKGGGLQHTEFAKRLRSLEPFKQPSKSESRPLPSSIRPLPAAAFEKAGKRPKKK